MEELLDLDVLDDELSPEEAAAWREVMEQDATAQEQSQEQEHGQGQEQEAGGFSEVYRAGLPPQSVGLLDRVGGAGGSRGAGSSRG